MLVSMFFYGVDHVEVLIRRDHFVVDPKGSTGVNSKLSPVLDSMCPIRTCAGSSRDQIRFHEIPFFC